MSQRNLQRRLEQQEKEARDRAEWEIHRHDIIVFATEPVTSTTLGFFIGQGFHWNRVGNSRQQSVVTVFNDSSSFRVGGVDYLIKLTQAISFMIGHEAYIRIEGNNFVVTPDSINPIDEIQEPIAVFSGGLDGPAKGWAGATRDYLWRSVKRHGNESFLVQMRAVLEDARPSERRKNIEKLLSQFQ